MDPGIAWYNHDREYLFDEGSKVFIRGVVNGNANYKPCYVWRVSVRRNDLAVI